MPVQTQDFFEFQEYKEALRDRIREVKQKNPSMTLRKLADLIPVQYTYLSKVLNQDGFHLSEDQLFVLGRGLKLGDEEMDFLFLLRSFAVSQDSDRKQKLLSRIESLRRKRNLNVKAKIASTEKLTADVAYLLNPLAVVVHVALSNEILRKNPDRLCSQLSISMKQLKQILKSLAVNDLIDLESDQLHVSAVRQYQYHLDKDHPLMRIHQSLLKTAALSRMSLIEEEAKQSIMVTFTASHEVYEQMKVEFQKYLKRVETLVRSSDRPRDHQQVYHLNFDLFRWL